MIIRTHIALACFACLFWTFFAQAQDGPAGVGADATNRFWFDASDFEGVVTNNTPVAAWPNKGGNNNSANQPTANAQPVYRDDAGSTMNGRPVYVLMG